MRIDKITNDDQLRSCKEQRDGFAEAIAHAEKNECPSHLNPELWKIIVESHKSIIDEFNERISEYEDSRHGGRKAPG